MTLLGLALAIVPACGAEPPSWTIEQAESIATIRGTPLRNQECRGADPSTNERHRRFSCIAGARRPGETIDTVAVRYELVPRGDYEGPTSDHQLENVRFIGGPGIP